MGYSQPQLEMCLIYEVRLVFSGESVDDCGGGYSESIAEMCEELQNALTPLLIVTPNGRDESGANRDCFLLNPAAKSLLHMSMFRFLGINWLTTQGEAYTGS